MKRISDRIASQVACRVAPYSQGCIAGLLGLVAAGTAAQAAVAAGTGGGGGVMAARVLMSAAAAAAAMGVVALVAAAWTLLGRSHALLDGSDGRSDASSGGGGALAAVRALYAAAVEGVSGGMRYYTEE